MIDGDVILGKNVRIFDTSLVNIFGCKIGNNTFIGPFVEITRGVIIGKNCKIESHSFICDSVTIDDDVFIGHGVMFTNNPFPAVGRHFSYKKVSVERGASIGTNATILPGVSIGEHAIIGAGAVVTRDIPAYSIAVGNPAKVIKKFESGADLFEYIKNKYELNF
jgi:acetyltransferase-like isoleucine patch superfamily enzyme